MRQDLRSGVGEFEHDLAGELGRRRFLNDLLVAALDGTIALEQVTHVAVFVGHDLELDVPRPFEQSLEVDLGGAETPFCHGARAFQQFDELILIVGGEHADPAAAGRLDEYWKTNLFGRVDCHFVVVEDVGAQPHRHAVLLHHVAGPGLVSHRFEPPRLGPDEAATRRFDPRGEGMILGKKAVSRVQAVRFRGLHDVHDGFLIEVALRGCRAADEMGLACVGEVGRILVGLGVNRDGTHAHPVQGPDDARGGCAAIRDDDFFEHGESVRRWWASC